MHTIFRLKSLKGEDPSEDEDVNSRIILEWTLGKQGGKGWTGCIWFRIRTSGGLS